jgi:hypothetical protein
MAGVSGKDPHMKKSTHAELERQNLERKRKLADAAAKFTQKKPVAPAAGAATELDKQVR